MADAGQDASTAHAQIISTACWLTMKEVAMLAGTLAQVAPLAGADSAQHWIIYLFVSWCLLSILLMDAFSFAMLRVILVMTLMHIVPLL